MKPSLLLFFLFPSYCVWITTSKNADAKIKKLAKELAGALPLFKFVARGDKPLSRMDRLAQRDGGIVYLVLGKSNLDGKPMLLSRHYIDDGDTCLWMWNGKRMEGLKVKKIKRKGEEPDEPYEFVIAGNDASALFAEFLGYSAGKTDENYEESMKVGIEAGEGTGKVKIGGKTAAEFKFAWKNINGSEVE